MNKLFVTTAPFAGHEQPDPLALLPTELRLLIFSSLFVHERPVIRGADRFDQHLYQEEDIGQWFPVHWQILATCQQYYKEAMPLLYRQNEIIFCTGKKGTAGYYERWPISKRCMPNLTRLGIYMSLVDTMNAQTSLRIALFLTAVHRHSPQLQSLNLLFSLSCIRTHECRRKILFPNHPVAIAMSTIIAGPNTLKHVKIRVHENARMTIDFATTLRKLFLSRGGPEQRTMTFSRSCACRSIQGWNRYLHGLECSHCDPTPLIGGPRSEWLNWPWAAEREVDAEEVEVTDGELDQWLDDADVTDMLVGDDQDENKDNYDDEDEDDRDRYWGGDFWDGNQLVKWVPSLCRREVLEADTNKAFSSATFYPPGHYPGKVLIPKVWSYRQTLLTDYWDCLLDRKEDIF